MPQSRLLALPLALLLACCLAGCQGNDAVHAGLPGDDAAHVDSPGAATADGAAAASDPDPGPGDAVQPPAAPDSGPGTADQAPASSSDAPPSAGVSSGPAEAGASSGPETPPPAAPAAEGSGPDVPSAPAAEGAAPGSPVPSPDWVAALPETREASQLFVVAVDGKSAAQASMHEKGDDGSWQMVLSCSGYIGKDGLGKARENDELTPQGSFIFDRAFGIAPDPGCAMTYTQVGDDVYWSGDAREGMHYNQMVSVLSLPGLDTQASEHLVDYWPEYEYCLNISFNNACTPGGGSAIFLHCKGSNPYTAGCVAIPRDAMEFVMQHVRPRCPVVIDTAENLGTA